MLVSFVLAARILVQDPCNDRPWLDAEAAAAVGDSVGRATVATLEAHAIPFEGAEQGIESIRGTVTGDAALEIVSGREMRAYGWCFSVNGRQPDLFPHEVRIEKDTDEIAWVFGFAHYLDGAWISMCTPTHLSRPAHVCGARD